MNSPKFFEFFLILTGIPGNSFKVLQNSGISQDFESAGFGILQKLLLSFLEILTFLGTQFSVVHKGGGGGVDIFWNSPMNLGVLCLSYLLLLCKTLIQGIQCLSMSTIFSFEWDLRTCNKSRLI